MQHSHSTLTFKSLILFPPTLYLLLLHPHHRLMLMAVSPYLLLSLPFPNSLRVLQWNAGGLRAMSTKLLHIISSNSVDLIYIQDSNLNLSSSFQIPEFSALRSDRTHSRSGIFSTDVADASGGVIIFVKQSLFSFELSTSSLSSLGPYSDYVEVNISPNDSSSLLFLNAYAPLFVLLRRIAEPISFLFPFFPLCGSGSGGIFRASASASTEKDRFHRFRFQLPLPLPHPWVEGKSANPTLFPGSTFSFFRLETFDFEASSLRISFKTEIKLSSIADVELRSLLGVLSPEAT